ncbi:hypothetical protein RhiirA4_464509 [Rhizophagus irregularis]|uniref:Uncharacterized protein n=1 Tax=Rhizophagus irregularis TaxID=588596 RepID=A0A2I1GQ87_9GLOM|nr:hypothetical protein RhiirA4_464509 [Rhizophagus irregularis]
MQDMKGVKYINVDKENNNTLITVEFKDMSKDTKFNTMDQNSKNQVYKRTLVCEFGGKYKSKKIAEAIFTTGIKSIARVKGYNWIIKQQLKVNSTLCKIVDRLDLKLNNNKYKQATTTNTTPIVE